MSELISFLEYWKALPSSGKHALANDVGCCYEYMSSFAHGNKKGAKFFKHAVKYITKKEFHFESD